MSYEQGFNDGERHAWDDRRGGSMDGWRALQSAVSGVLSEYWRGFRDGYSPRTQAWVCKTEWSLYATN